MTPLLRIESTSVAAPGHLRLRFSDGDERTVDVRPLMRGSALEKLQAESLFAQVAVDERWGTVVWPGDLDFAPEALRSLSPVELTMEG